MTFQQKLDSSIKKNNSLVCVGLDTTIDKIPSHLRESHEALFTFNKEIIDATHAFVSTYKLNSAFYEASGEKGVEQLQKTCTYIQDNYPEIPIILDAKRADIGNTNEGYISYAFSYLNVDAITLQPYLGSESLEPFLQLKDKGIIVLCRTSNPGAREFQDLVIDGRPLYQHVAENIVQNWNKNGNCMLVVGATYPNEMKIIRAIAGDMTFLVPGIGVQGGDLESTMKNGLNTKKAGLIIHSARAIIYASSGKDFAEVAAEKAKELKDKINTLRK